MTVEAEYVGELIPNLPESEPMRYILNETKTQLSQGTTIRLLRCRNKSKPKPKPDDPDPLVKISRTKNELVASSYDEKKAKWRDFIRMTVADTLPEAMPAFIALAKKEIERLLPKFQDLSKLETVDCRTVQSFSDFAEALQRR